MKKTIFIFFAFAFVAKLYGQDTVWKKINVDDNLVIALPGEVSQIDTLGIQGDTKMKLRIFKTQMGVTTIALVITPNEMKSNVNDKESLKTALHEIATGTCNAARAKGLSCLTTDTTINSLPCVRSEIFSGEENHIAPRVNYTFLVNDKLYMFTIAAFDPHEIYVNAATVLKNIHFTSTRREQQFNSKVDSVAYNIGYIFGLILIPLIVIGVVIYFVRRKQ